MNHFKLLRLTVHFLLALFLFIVLYFITAFVFSSIPVNSNFTQTKVDGIGIYLLTNGLHTDLVLPVRNRYKDWSEAIAFNHTTGKDSMMNYMAFGWGDKNFYLETPTWADLKFSTAFNALFFLSEAAMHVTMYQHISEDDHCIKVSINAEQYNRMVKYIGESFKKKNQGEFMLIPNLSYGPDDCFYEAKGTFNLFYTCNTWTNEGLRQSGLRASLWTPFDGPLMNHYNKKGRPVGTLRNQK